MTTSENEPKPLMDPLVGAIFTQMSKDAAWTQNQLDKHNQEEIQIWKSRFLRLFDAVEEANDKVDSFRIHSILVGFGQAANTAAKDLDTH